MTCDYTRMDIVEARSTWQKTCPNEDILEVPGQIFR